MKKCNRIEFNNNGKFTTEEIRDLLIKVNSGCMKSRDVLFEAFYPFVYKTASVYFNDGRYGQSPDDIMSEASIALLKALRSFSVDKSNGIALYIKNKIIWHLNDYVNDCNLIRVPNPSKIKIKSIENWVNNVYETTGSYPTIENVTKTFNISVTNAIAYMRIIMVKVNTDNDNFFNITKNLPDEYVDGGFNGDNTLMHIINDYLTPDEQFVITGLYGVCGKLKTKKKICEELNKSRFVVSEIKNKAFNKIKTLAPSLLQNFN